MPVKAKNPCEESQATTCTRLIRTTVEGSLSVPADSAQQNQHDGQVILYNDVDFDNVDFETSGYKASDPSGQSRSLGHVLQPMVLRHQIRPPGMRHFL